MKRREFLTAVGVSAIGFKAIQAGATDAKAAKITDADVLKEGQPTTIANYCDPKKKSKACPPEIKGVCGDCQFYNKPEPSETTFKGKKVAKCQLVTAKPQYVFAEFSCATFVKKT